ncbi:MAG: efflux RND transporter periplasmic adaptor subunit [Betaproteobacteria bacterium]|nr:efflux RND transporter periplasmic adaptor subunit [Betaproteobacteria bacterium]
MKMLSISAIALAGGLAAATVTGVALTSAGNAQEKAAEKSVGKPALTVTWISPQSAQMPFEVQATGSIAAWQEAIIGAEAGGLRVTEVRVNVGDVVSRGQVLATLAAETIEADLAQSRANLAEAEAALADARANAARAREVQASGTLSQQQVAQLLTAEKTGEARMLAARAQVAAQEIRLKHATVTAPDSGSISARVATVGAVVPQGQELFRLIRGDRLEWRAEVTSAEIARIRPGQAVTVTAATGASAAGRVRVVAPTVDPQTRNALVYVDLPGAATRGGGFKAGMFARGSVATGSAMALTLPLAAISLRDGYSYVFVLGAGNRVTQVKVQLGRRAGERVEVLGALSGSERVVASGAAFLADGDLVRVVQK